MAASIPFPSMPTLILDNGAHSIKAMYSNQTEPSYVFCTLLHPFKRRRSSHEPHLSLSSAS